jgi:hypothetical protein
MKKFFYLFLNLIICVSLSGQSNRLSVSGGQYPVSPFIRSLHSLNNTKQNISTLQRVRKVESESGVIKQQLDSMVQATLNTTTNVMYDEYKNVYKYDTKGNRIQETDYYFSKSLNSLVGDVKYESTYNEVGQLLTDTTFSWNTSTNKWELTGKNETLYDNGKKSVMINYYLSSGIWQNSRKIMYEYDTNGNIVLETGYSWSSGIWNNVYKTQYVYDANEIMTEMIYYYSDFSNNWVMKSKEAYTNDGFNISSGLDYSWNSGKQSWTQYRKFECFFDLNTLTSNVFSNELIDRFGKNKITSAKLYNYDGTNWVYNGLATMYYSTHDNLTGTKTVADDVLKVYPNPASDYITFNVDKMAGQFTVQLIDLQGKIVLNQLTSNDNMVSIDKLPKGLYLYKVTANSKVYNGKIIVK